MAEIVHVCRPGDSLTRIAVTYYGDVKRVRELQTYNKLIDADKLRVGQPIRVPNPSLGVGANSIALNPGKINNLPPKKEGVLDHLLENRPLPVLREPPKAPLARAPTAPTSGAEFRKVLEAGKFGLDVLGKTFDGMDKYIELLIVIFRLDKEDLESGKSALSKGKGFVEGLVSAYDCYLSLLDQDFTQATGQMLIAMGILWPFVPAAQRNVARERMRKLLSHNRLTAGLEVIVEVLERINALGSLAKMIAAPTLKENRWLTFNSGQKELIKALMENPGEAAKAAPALAAFLWRHLPEHLVEKLAFRFTGKKIPLVGTLVVGILDIADIVSDPKDAKNWASLGSTAAGAFPGVGTAASAVIDLSVLALTVAENIDKVNGGPGKIIEVDLQKLSMTWVKKKN